MITKTSSESRCPFPHEMCSPFGIVLPAPQTLLARPGGLREAINPPSPKGLPACKITSSSPLQSLLQILPDSLVFSFRKSSSRGPATSAFRAGRRCRRQSFVGFFGPCWPILVHPGALVRHLAHLVRHLFAKMRQHRPKMEHRSRT